MTVLVPLTKGHHAVIDDADADRVFAMGKWCALERKNTVYAMRGARRADGGQTTIRLHNFLTGLDFVDHINGDGLDNRQSNLRAADYTKNARNRAKSTGTTSPYKGVWWETRRGIWTGQIRVNRKRIYLGAFTDIHEAARAYDAAAAHHFGAYARLNFPQETAA